MKRSRTIARPSSSIRITSKRWTIWVIALAAKGQFDEAIENYRKAIQVNSNHPETFFHLGMTLGQLGRNREAVAQYREALRLNPNLARALSNLAWMLATSPDDELRNGAEAVRLAERACELTHHGEPLFIGTLAAAYAEAGRFPEAVTTAEKAERLATDAGLAAVAAKNRQLLELLPGRQTLSRACPNGAMSSVEHPRFFLTRFECHTWENSQSVC